MPDEKELIKKRASYKGRLTSFYNYLNTLNESEMIASQAGELQLRLSKMEKMYDQYDEIQLQLECKDDLDAQLSERDDFESIYYKALFKAQGMLTNYSKSAEKANFASSHVSTNCKPVKLPTIQLPKFSGGYGNWLEFRDTFLSLIHSNNEIDKINKFHYLRASLEGTAAVVIQSIEFSSTNYDVAWNLLCDRFNNNRLLIQNHVSAIFNIESITRESSVSLKRLIDQLNKNLRALDSLGEPTVHWGTLLIYIVTQKLDTKTFREWEEYKGRCDKNTNISFQLFLNFLNSHADLIETLELSRNTQVSPPSKNNIRIKTMMSLQESGNSLNNTISLKSCPKCGRDHKLHDCPQFLALSNTQRLQLLPKFKICYNCFRSDHFANVCKKSGCKICKRKHNVLVHVTELTRKPEYGLQSAAAVCRGVSPGAGAGTMDRGGASASGRAAPTGIVSPPVAGLTPDVALSASVAAQNCGTQDVLLSTALVKLYDRFNNEHVARALLDSGSTSCLITEKMCHILDLPFNAVDRSLLGINNSNSHIVKMCMVPMRSLDENYSSTINCFVLPSITDNVPCRKINILDLNIPSDLCLADPYFHVPAEIDLIIGADLFWDLLGSNKIKLGDRKPILNETRLGWIISGTLSGTTATDFIISSNLCKQLEEVSPQSCYSAEEKLCDDHFIKNTTRLSDGRICVKIPLKQNSPVLGDSFQRACFHLMR